MTVKMNKLPKYSWRCRIESPRYSPTKPPSGAAGTQANPR